MLLFCVLHVVSWPHHRNIETKGFLIKTSYCMSYTFFLNVYTLFIIGILHSCMLCICQKPFVFQIFLKRSPGKRAALFRLLLIFAALWQWVSLCPLLTNKKRLKEIAFLSRCQLINLYLTMSANMRKIHLFDKCISLNIVKNTIVVRNKLDNCTGFENVILYL